MTAWWLVVQLAGALMVGWSWSSMFISVFGLRREPFLWLHRELKPFYLPAVTVQTFDSAIHGSLIGWPALFMALNYVAWSFYKDIDDDDDRWNRRRRKLAEKVSRVGGRLVVVPAQAGSR